MKKVEQYIKDYTKICSNENVCGYYEPWLTPDHAKAVAQIAREETIKEVCEWLDSHLIDYWSQSVTDGSKFIEDLKKHLEDKL